MVQPATVSPQWWQRPIMPLVGTGLVAVVAVYVGFLAVDSATAERLINRGGYFVMVATFAWWLVSLWRLRTRWLQAAPADSEARAAARRGWWVALGLALLFTGATLGMQSLQSNVLYDEYVLQSTAYNMHMFREVGAMVRGYELLGTFTSLDNYLDKRPYFYPFLISLAHDLTGYRVLNAYLINVLLMPVGLLLAYDLGRQWHGWRGGLAALLLLATLPLYAQNATGSGMEMLNIVMLLLTVRVGGIYLQRPDAPSLTAFCLSTVLLAQCRYESAIFAGCAALVVLVGWWRAGRLVLSWGAALTPLLLVPVAWHNKVLSNSPVLWELKEDQGSRFEWQYVPDNAQGMFEYWFLGGVDSSNSVFISVLGAAALIWVIGLLLRSLGRLRELDAHALAGLAFGLGVAANLVLLLFYYWARFTDPLASRFSLPAYVAVILCVVAVLRWADARWSRATPVLLALTLVNYLGFTVPKQSSHLYSHLGSNELEWERRVVAARPDVPRLVLTNKSTLVWLMDRTPSVMLGRAIMVQDRIAHQLADSHFTEILVTQELRPVTAEGHYQIVPEDVLPEQFELETLIERRFGTKIVRISRLVALTLAEEPVDAQ